MTDSSDNNKGSSGRSVFQYRDYRLLWVSRLIAGLSNQMQLVAVGWLVYDITHDPLALGLIGLIAFLPWVALVLVTGQVADRFDRRLILVFTYIVSSAVSFGLFLYALGGPTKVWPIYCFVLVLGVTRAFAMPTTSALMPNLVPKKDLGHAIAWSSSAYQVATIVGPALGGVLYIWGPALVFALSSGGIALTAVILFQIRPRPVQGRPERMNWANVLAGIVYIRSKPVIFGAVTLDMVAVLLGGAEALLPVYARDILAIGPLGLGIMRSMPAAGAVCMAVFLAKKAIKSRVGLQMFVAVAIFGVATIAFGLSKNLYFSLGCLFVLGAADMISVYVRQTLVQIETPDAMRGRVAAMNSLFIGTSNQLGEFESGTVARLIGTIPCVVVGGIGTLMVSGLWARWFPELRRRDTLVPEHDDTRE
ncbi:MAG TPA: MFS transporter [Alphaproteobacteria bacterium]|nr:MFS transporter [Alphaproteobacteria bacterium]